MPYSTLFSLHLHPGFQPHFFSWWKHVFLFSSYRSHREVTDQYKLFVYDLQGKILSQNIPPCSRLGF